MDFLTYSGDDWAGSTTVTNILAMYLQHWEGFYMEMRG